MKAFSQLSKIATALALALSGSALYLGHASARTANVAGWVVGVNGNPSITRSGHSEPARRGKVVLVGDLIETDARSKIKVLFTDDSVMAVGPRSSVSLPDYNLRPNSRTVELKVLFGRFKVNIAKFFLGRSVYKVATPTAVAGVRGTILWGDTELDAMCALEGNIEVTPLSREEPAKLAAGECVGGMGKGQTDPLSPSPEDLAKYLAEVTLE